MSTYAIGDIQGCYQPFMALLEAIHFDKDKDTLWLTGDLVNRGPQSLEVLRFVYALGDRHQIVLGNHDLHLLALAVGAREPSDGDTLSEIMVAPDKDELLDWLRHRPLLVRDEQLGFVMSHAGLCPSWTVDKAMTLAQEVEAVLRGNAWRDFFPHMYGNQPDRWSDTLAGTDRLRCIVNYFTRMRYCHADGRMNLVRNNAVADMGDSLVPWFDVSIRVNADVNIIFGHWAALEGKVSTPNLYAMDTGCVWGRSLSAMRLEDGALFSTPCTVSS